MDSVDRAIVFPLRRWKNVTQAISTETQSCSRHYNEPSSQIGSRWRTLICAKIKRRFGRMGHDGNGGLCIEKGKIMDAKHISSDNRVFAVYDVTGDWDSMVLARVKNREDLDDLTKTVFTLDGISRSYTHVVLNTVKESGVILPEE